MATKFTPFQLAIRGIEKLDGLAEKIGDAVNREIHQTTIREAHKLAGKIQKAAPEITGDLRSRVRAGGFKKRSNQQIAAFVFMHSDGTGPSNLPVLVEFGTVRAAPKPYFRPTVNANRSDIMDALADGAKRGVVKLGKFGK